MLPEAIVILEVDEAIFILEVEDTTILPASLPTVTKNKLESPLQVAGCLFILSDPHAWIGNTYNSFRY